jgi:hypothetical protein
MNYGTRQELYSIAPQSSEASGHRLCWWASPVASRQPPMPWPNQHGCSRRLLGDTRSPTSAPSGGRPCLQIRLHVE